MTSLVRKVLKTSSVALMLKLVAAPASFAMLFALANAMSFDEYGRFAFGFSLALVLAKASALGQPQLMLRILPGLDEMDSRWRSAVRFGLRNVIVAGSLAVLAMASIAFSQDGTIYLLAAAPLCILLALSELQSALLRTRDKIIWALAPREVLWRCSIILLAILFWTLPLSNLSATLVFSLSSFSLALVLLLQCNADAATRYRQSLRGEIETPSQEWRRLSGRFWLNSLVIFGTPNLAVVIVGAVIDVSDSGPFFAALKTAQLMQLVLMAANIATMPMISRYHQQDDHAAIQAVCSTVSVAAGLVSALALLVLVLFGKEILRLFGQGFEVSYREMIVLGVGFLVSGLNGPNGAALNMTGHEGVFNRILLLCNGSALVCLAPAVYIFGPIGAACVVSGSMILWNVVAWNSCRRLTGIDPSIIGAFRRDSEVRRCN